MAIAVLSPCLLEVRKQDEQLHYFALAKLLENLFLHTTLKFQHYKKSPYDSYKMVIPEYKDFALNNLVLINIYGIIQKMLLPEYVNLDGIDNVNLPSKMAAEDNDLTSAFSSYLNYLKNTDAIIFIGKDSFDIERPIKFCSDSDIEFSIKASTYVEIELTDVLLPYLKTIIEDENKIFPRYKFCQEYNNYVINIIHNNLTQSEKIAIFEKIGTLVAIYNGYVKDLNLTKKNNRKNMKRIVFRKMQGKKFYLSLDLESGGFEVFDAGFKHLGQYNFSGSKIKDASPLDHKLIK